MRNGTNGCLKDCFDSHDLRREGDLGGRNQAVFAPEKPGRGRPGTGTRTACGGTLTPADLAGLWDPLEIVEEESDEEIVSSLSDGSMSALSGGGGDRLDGLAPLSKGPG